MHVSSDQIAATLEHRKFGTGIVDDTTFQEPVPEALRVLAIQLKERSALLKLRSDTTLEKQQVYNAYRVDLHLLKERIASLEHCVKEAVRGSVIVGRKVPWSEDGSVHSTVEKLWQELKNEIPPVGQEPFLVLDYKLAAEPATDILVTLQQQFERSIDQILRLITCWLHLLVEHNLVGLVEWTDTDVARYHYFVHDQRREVLETKRSTETEVDNNQPYGQRTTYTNVREEKIRTRRYLERHVHHIVNARVHDLEAYPDKMPARVTEFLEKVPDWMRPLLQIVAGEITMEEIIRRKVSDETATEKTIESVFKGSPAVTLGNFALVGWSSDDIIAGDARYSERQTVAITEHREFVRQCVKWGFIVVPLLSIAVTGFILIHQTMSESAQKEYDNYVSKCAWLVQSPTFTAKRGESLVLEGVEVPICFMGYEKTSMRTAILLSREEPTSRGKMTRVYSLQLPHQDMAGRNYGNVSLGKDFGLHISLSILEVDRDDLRYKVDYNPLHPENSRF